MRQVDKNRVGKAYGLVEQAEEKLRKIKSENLSARATFIQIRALRKCQELRKALTDLATADIPEELNNRPN